jgi:CDGSH-type Zn-finger protein/uncharacterized Fe-S cluster protein YjdI
MASEPESKQHTYRGSAVEVVWDTRLCIHVGECTHARGEVFEVGRRPWCDPDRADAGTVAAVVERCPTGALSYTRSDGGRSEATPAANTIAVANNGPLYVRGELEIEGAPADAPGLRTRAALCRCGLSTNKPFCDNSHEAAGFRDHGAIGEKGETLEAHGGPLKINPRPNGPLVISGNLTLTSAAGLPTWSGTRVALCRCGESSNKPFCDGTHALVGFSTDAG